MPIVSNPALRLHTPLLQRSALIATAVLTAACSDRVPTAVDAPITPVAPSDTSSRPAPPLAKLRVYGADGSVQMFDTLRLGVEALDSDGRVVPTPALYTEIVSKPQDAVATIDASGFSARTEGEYRIRVATAPSSSAFAVADTVTVQVRGIPEVAIAVQGLDSLSVATGADWSVRTAFTRGGALSPLALPRTTTVEDTTIAVYVPGADGESGRLEARAPGLTEVVTRVLGGQVLRTPIRVVPRPLQEMRVTSDRGDSTLFVRDKELLTTAVLDSGAVAFREVTCEARVVEGQSIAVAPTEHGCVAYALETGLSVLEFSVNGVRLRVERWVRDPEGDASLSPRVAASRVVHLHIANIRP